MTVRDAVNVLKCAKTIALGYGDNSVPFSKDDPLMMDAYGAYKVDAIAAVGELDYYEIVIAMQPIREGF